MICNKHDAEASASCSRAPAHRYELLLARVQHSNLLVLAGGCYEAAIVVPGHGVDDVRVEAIQGGQLCATGRVPDDDLVVKTNSGQHVLSAGVPYHVADLRGGREGEEGRGERERERGGRERVRGREGGERERERERGGREGGREREEESGGERGREGERGGRERGREGGGREGEGRERKRGGERGGEREREREEDTDRVRARERKREERERDGMSEENNNKHIRKHTTKDISLASLRSAPLDAGRGNVP